MENLDLQLNLEMMENTEFEEKVDIDDLVLPPKQTGTPNMDTSNIKQEPVENFRSEIMPSRQFKPSPENFIPTVLLRNRKSEIQSSKVYLVMFLKQRNVFYGSIL